MSAKVTIIDSRHHLLGRLSSIIAQELLAGNKVAVVRCEEINMTGAHRRNKLKLLQQFKKRSNTCPRKGAVHYRAPSRILWRTVRGMIPHKTSRGAAAMARLKVFDGVPPPFDKVKRMVVPDALRCVRLHPSRKYSTLGRLSSELGWNFKPVIETLEAKRKVKSLEFHKTKVASLKLREKALAAPAVKKVSEELAKFGY